MTPERLDSVRLPNGSIRLMCGVLEEEGVHAAPLLEAAGISADSVQDPLGEVLGEQELRLQELFVDATRHSPESWFRLGRRFRLMTFPLLGPAMLTSGTVREGLETVVTYQALTYDMLQYGPYYDGGVLAGMEADDRVVPEPLRDFVFRRGLAAATMVIRDMCPSLPIDRVEVPFDAPRRGPREAHVLGVPVRYRAPRLRWVFRRGAGTLRLPFASSVMADLYQKRCRDHLALGDGDDALIERVAVRLLQSLPRLPSVERMAGELRVSKRTLQRQLAKRELTYGQLLDRVRRERACRLLGGSRLTVAEVGAALGFAEAASFSRAFKRWTGRAPSAYRRESARSA